MVSYNNLSNNGSEQLKSDFNLISQQYDSLKRSVSYDKIVIDKMNSLFTNQNINILEFGCATGNFIKTLNDSNITKTFKINLITATDISDSMIEQAQKNLIKRNNITFINSLDTKNSYEIEEKKFDLIVSKFVLHDYAEPFAVFENWLKYLKPGGYIIIIDRFKYKFFLRRVISFFVFEFWLFGKFMGLTGSVFKTIKWMISDIKTWFSVEWKSHRKNENIMFFSKLEEHYRLALSLFEFKKINDRAYCVVGRKISID